MPSALLMKFLRIIILLLVFPMLSAASVHKFYVSITKMEYVKDKSSLQITTKIFTDDLENALRKRYERNIFLDSKKETTRSEVDLKKYILQNIRIKVNGKSVQLNYLGKEYDTDMLVAYMEVNGISDLKSIEVENTVLMEVFTEQQNIIHLKTPKSRKSLILEKDEPSGKLRL